MLERYHEAMITAVNRLLLLPLDPKVLWLLLRRSPGGVAGMSSTWSLVSSANNLGLLILRVVHVCASTIANGGRKKKSI